jgi:geranylgeranyl pyrophosphate synthase
MSSLTPVDVIQTVGLEGEWWRLRQRVTNWVERSDPDLRPMLRQQFQGGSKYFRPLTVFACHYAVSSRKLPPETVFIAAQAIEMFHNVTLIVDDLVDKSKERREKLTLHEQYDPLTAWMVAGYIDACAADLLASQLTDEWADQRGDDDETRARWGQSWEDRSETLPGAKDRASDSVLASRDLDSGRDWKAINEAGPVRFDLRLLSELKRRLAVAECVQWDNRNGGVLRKGKKRLDGPLGLADWRYLAREDTGSMFEICACLGARSQRYRRLGRLLGMLYHGCDDVADVAKLEGLGDSEGGNEDLKEGILTLPAALAIQNDATIREVFCKETRDEEELGTLLDAFRAQLNRARGELDEIAHQAQDEARYLQVRNDAQIRRLIDQVRALGGA